MDKVISIPLYALSFFGTHDDMYWSGRCLGERVCRGFQWRESGNTMEMCVGEHVERTQLSHIPIVVPLNALWSIGSGHVKVEQ